MTVTAIVGAQWGDEGKGKITDLLAQNADLVIRFNGGSNAGHTVINEHGEFGLHIIPSGIFNPRAICLIGTGTVVYLDTLADEVAQLEAAGVSTAGLKISSRAHLVMPYHLQLDRLQDQARGADAIGTTGRGIGPAYVDKADRVGVQAGDLLDLKSLRRKIQRLIPAKNRLLAEHGQPGMDADELLGRLDIWRENFGPRIVDHVQVVADCLHQDGNILLEGQLGAMRDLDWGTYPFVTSSTTIAGGGAVGGAVPVGRIDRVVGVVKAYTSAVGEGPVPTELTGPEGDALRDRGGEYGTTTGRPRRVGWFDAVAVRFANLLNGFSELAITKLDVLDATPTLPLCAAYRGDAEVYHSVPVTATLERVQPEYEKLPGWNTPTSGARKWEELPERARAYVSRIEELVGARASIVSVGPERSQTIKRPAD